MTSIAPRLFLLLLLVVLASPASEASYTLSTDARTSAGVYAADGTLVRTLWSGRLDKAGTHPIAWDRTDDLVKPVPPGDYTVRILSSNVAYEWQGVIGNTSARTTGPGIHRATSPALSIAIVGSNVYYTTGYGEGGGPMNRFRANTPQIKETIFTAVGGNQICDYLCSDGERMYWAIYDPFAKPHVSYVFASAVADDALVAFPQGAPYKPVAFDPYASVVDRASGPDSHASGLAVGAKYLFVSHRDLGEIHVIDKSSGAAVRSLPFVKPGPIAVDGDHLWVSYDTRSTPAAEPAGGTISTTVEKFAIAADGSLGRAILSLAGVSEPADLKVHGTSLAIVDGGTSQQVKFFDTRTGAAGPPFGQPGGNLTSPVVSNDRFAFWMIGEGDEDGVKHAHGSIAFAADGSFWLADAANRRMLHFDRNRKFLEHIVYQGKTYSAYCDPGNHARLMANMLEFEVDYTSPIATCWKLTYNWEGGHKPGYNVMLGIKWMSTLANKRTYALMVRGGGQFEVVELLPTGLRYTGVLIPYGSTKMYPDGSIVTVDDRGEDNPEVWTRRTLTGFDASNNPIYSAGDVVLTAKETAAPNPRLSGAQIYPYELTSSNVLACFRGNRVRGDDPCYHLGGMDPATGRWLWRASQSTGERYGGAFPDNGDFDSGNGAWYQGSVAVAFDRNIIWGYNGEAWKGGQTNKWNHFHDDGLFIGQFGITSFDYQGEAPAGMAGNGFSPSVVKEGGAWYLYHNDESHHGGIHRWKITGLESIREQTVPVTAAMRTDEAPRLGGLDLMAGLPYRGVLASGTAGWTRSPDSESDRWSARTGIFTYQRRAPYDLYVTYNVDTAGTNFIARSLGNNIGLATWRLSGQVNFNNFDSNGPDGNGLNQYLDVLDGAGKIIVRFHQRISYATLHVTTYANDSELFHLPVVDMKFLTERLQPLEIARTPTGIAVAFAGKPGVTVTRPYEAGAEAANPATMRLTFTSDGRGYPKAIGISAFRFEGGK